jgi:NDP-4-keto-2,6-dideoxyhexose 3-C-methyltransferase
MRYSVTTACRACGNQALIPILDLGDQALTGRFPSAEEVDPPAMPLRLVLCDISAAPDACGLIQLGHSGDLGEMYGSTYGYRSSITQTMVQHLRGTAERVLGEAKAQPGDWLLEIGSNDGTMQKFLAGSGVNLVAIDPSAAKFAADYPKESILIADFFSEDLVKSASGGEKFKAIISIAMFYDLEQPLEFMKSVRNLLAEDGVWCFEQAYLPAILSSLCYDTICHEHLCYYGLTQIDWLAKRAGLRLLNFSLNDINGGSFTVFACRDDSKRPSDVSALSRRLASEAEMRLGESVTWEEFARQVRLHRARVRTFFEDARADGKLVLGLGASTKGNVLLQYADITKDLMPAIADRDPKKVGLRTPGTGIPIISEDDARRLQPDFFFAFPWHFRNEIAKREKTYLDRGGRIVFPLPHFHAIRRGDVSATEGVGQPLHKISWARPILFGDERSAVADALDSTMISGGHYVEEFERQFAAMHGPGVEAITTTNGTTALQLAYLALGVGPGDEVIVPGWGFMAAANMALAVGATPVFADIDSEEWLLDPDQVAAKITPRTKAIVATHTYGNVCNMDALGRIAKESKIFLIEDCAESMGSVRAGKICGTVADIACFSFQATKLITCGEGGAILCNAADVSKRARLIRNHGMEGPRRYWHYAIGHNMRLSNLLCAVLCAQLRHWPKVMAARARLFDGYRRRLARVPDLAFQTFSRDVQPVIWAIGLRHPGLNADTRDRVLTLMSEEGIECRPGFYPPGVQTIYGQQAVRNADKLSTQILVPPIDGALTDDQLDYICNTLTKSLESALNG